MSFKIKLPSSLATQPKTKVVVEDEADDNKFSLKPKKEKPKPEFLVSDQFGNFFCHYRHGYPYWSNLIAEARELTEEAHFQTLVRWHKDKKLKKEYL